MFRTEKFYISVPTSALTLSSTSAGTVEHPKSSGLLVNTSRSSAPKLKAFGSGAGSDSARTTAVCSKPRIFPLSRVTETLTHTNPPAKYTCFTA